MIGKICCKRCNHEWIQRQIALPKMCPNCKSKCWDKEKKGLLNLRYLDYEDLIELNRESIKQIPVKKADTHKVLSMVALMEISNNHRTVKGDIWDKASYLLKELIKRHPFASANRRTATEAAILLLKMNKQRCNIRNHVGLNKILQGIREDHYTMPEIKNWLMRGEIHEFNR